MARVDLFASKDNSHGLIIFTRSTDALAHKWPSLPFYAFPTVALLPQVLRRVMEQRHKLILIAPLWKNQLWVSELFQLLKAAPWPIPLRRDIHAFHAPIAGRTVGRECGNSIFTRRQENESPASSYSSTLGFTNRTEGPRRAPVWTIAIIEPQSTLVENRPAVRALASVKRVGDQQALSVNPVCLEFGPNDSSVVLKPRLGFVPKVLSRTAFCWLR